MLNFQNLREKFKLANRFFLLLDMWNTDDAICGKLSVLVDQFRELSDTAEILFTILSETTPFVVRVKREIISIV